MCAYLLFDLGDPVLQVILLGFLEFLCPFHQAGCEDDGFMHIVRLYAEPLSEDCLEPGFFVLVLCPAFLCAPVDTGLLVIRLFIGFISFFSFFSLFGCCFRLLAAFIHDHGFGGYALYAVEAPHVAVQKGRVHVIEMEPARYECLYCHIRYPISHSGYMRDASFHHFSYSFMVVL